MNNLTGFGNWWFWGGGLFGFILKLLIFVVLLYFLFKLVRPNNLTASENLDRKDSLEIIKERFAKGEINDQEYQRLKDILS